MSRLTSEPRFPWAIGNGDTGRGRDCYLKWLSDRQMAGPPAGKRLVIQARADVMALS